VEGIAIVPYRTPPGGHLHADQANFNKELSGIRAAAERAVASVKTWRMLSGEGGRYRTPISKYRGMLAAVTGLFFFGNYYNPYE
jgi:DDE superfamily endonuclease